MTVRLFTVREVAEEHLRMKRATVYQWISEGRLPAVRLGRTLRVREADLEKAIAQGLPSHPSTAA